MTCLVARKTSLILVAVAGARRLRVCGYRPEGAPLVADGAHVLDLEQLAHEAGVPVDSIEITEVAVDALWREATA